MAPQNPTDLDQLLISNQQCIIFILTRIWGGRDNLEHVSVPIQNQIVDFLNQRLSNTPMMLRVTAFLEDLFNNRDLLTSILFHINENKPFSKEEYQELVRKHALNEETS